MALKLLTKTTTRLQDQMDPSWRSQSGVAWCWMEYDGSRIRLIRIPSVSTTYTIGFVERPTVVTALGNTTDARIPDAIAKYLKYAVASYLLSLAGTHEDLQKAGLMMAEFYRSIGVEPGPLANTTLER